MLPAFDPDAPWPRARLQAFRDGEPETLREVYRAHVRGVATLLRRGFSFESRGNPRRFGGYDSAFDLHDALQETFRRAFERRARTAYDGLRPYGPYLHTIARNLVLKEFRRRERLFPGDALPSARPGEARAHLPDPAGDPERALGRERIRARVQAFLAGLEAEDRQLVELRFVAGKSQRDAAETLGIGRQRLRTRERRLRQRLLDTLGDEAEVAQASAWPVALLLCLGEPLFLRAWEMWR